MNTPISLEFFPPKTAEGAEKLRQTRQKLYAARPEFCSVTFGAGGSTQDGTLATVQEILAEGMAAAPHLSCIGQTRESIRQRLDTYRSTGMRRIVALRGDLPSGYGADVTGEFRYASDLIAFIRAETGDYFTLEVAAYPETHPQARSPAADLDAFATKVAAGANAAITQYFFNADAYFRFIDELAARQIHLPVAPGIMPITNSTQLLRFSDFCGTEVPLLGAPAAGELWRRRRVHQGLRAGCGGRPVRTPDRRRRARPAPLHHEPKRPLAWPCWSAWGSAETARAGAGYPQISPVLIARCAASTGAAGVLPV